MKTSRLILLAAFAGGLLSACKFAPPVSPRTHEEPRSSLFPHEKHGGFDCVDCHTGIPKATRLGEAALPGVVKCAECHPEIQKPTDEQTRKAAAAAASLGSREPREYQLSFSHADHLRDIQTKEVNDTCKTCHRDDQLPEVGESRKTTPKMQACTACHIHTKEVAEARCTPCHVSLRRYPLKPIEALVGLSHQGNFIREHGKIIRIKLL